MLKQRGFVLLTAIGILAILGTIIYGLALNAEFTYRYSRFRSNQRALAQVLHTAAELLARNPEMLAKLSAQPSTLPLTPRDNLTVRGAIVPKSGRATGKIVALDVFDKSAPHTPGRAGIFILREKGTPLALTEFALAQESQK